MNELYPKQSLRSPAKKKRMPSKRKKVWRKKRSADNPAVEERQEQIGFPGCEDGSVTITADPTNQFVDLPIPPPPLLWVNTRKRISNFKNLPYPSPLSKPVQTDIPSISGPLVTSIPPHTPVPPNPTSSNFLEITNNPGLRTQLVTTFSHTPSLPSSQPIPAPIPFVEPTAFNQPSPPLSDNVLNPQTPLFYSFSGPLIFNFQQPEAREEDDGLVSDSGDESSHCAENLDDQEEIAQSEEVVRFISNKVVEVKELLKLTETNSKMSESLFSKKEKKLGLRSQRRKKRAALLLQVEG